MSNILMSGKSYFNILVESTISSISDKFGSGLEDLNSRMVELDEISQLLQTSCEELADVDDDIKNKLNQIVDQLRKHRESHSEIDTNAIAAGTALSDGKVVDLENKIMDVIKSHDEHIQQEMIIHMYVINLL